MITHCNRVWVLAEDNAHLHVIAGLTNLRIIRRGTWIAPKSQGAGSAFVLRQLDEWLGELRRRQASQPELGGVVMIDGDGQTMAARKAALATRLTRPRQHAERIAWLVPCRNIETWIVYASGQSGVDEQTNYKPQSHSALPMAPTQAGTELRQTRGSWQLPSLQDADQELSRL